MAELERVDIFTDTSMISSHIVLTQCGHLERLFHMSSYLKKHQNSYMLFDPTETDVDMADFQHEYWGLSIYGNFKEEMPPSELN